MLKMMDFSARVREALKNRHIWHHPFMKLLYAGKLTPQQVRGWIVNRYYFLKSVPVKDAIILSKCTDPELRKLWLIRLARREGLGGYLGDVEGWAEFARAAGIPRQVLEKSKVLPGVKMAVNAYLDFARNAHWLYAMSATLAEIMLLEELPRRLKALTEMYGWIEPGGLEFFFQRLGYLSEELDTISRAIEKKITSKDQLKKCIAAVRFNCDIQWTILDSVYMKYVMHHYSQSQSL